MSQLFIVVLCVFLSGCGYGSTNMIRVQGKDCTLLGAEGYIRVQNASATIYRNMDCKTKSMEDDTRPRPNILESGPASNISIGTPKSIETHTTTDNPNPTPSPLPIVGGV